MGKLIRGFESLSLRQLCILFLGDPGPGGKEGFETMLA
jgi:hypothetical protein